MRQPYGLGTGRGGRGRTPLNPRHPLHDPEGDSGRTGYRGNFPGVIAGPSASILPPQAAPVNRRVVSDPVYGTKERRKFLDPIEEAVDEAGDEGRSNPGPRVRFRSKSVATVIPPFLQARGRTPAAGDCDPHRKVEDPSPENSISIFETREVDKLPMEEGEKAEDADDGMDTEELLRDFEEAFHSPVASSTFGRAAPSDPIHRIKSVLDVVVPESHSTPAASKPSVASRRVPSSPPSPSGPAFNNPPQETTGIGMPRPNLFNASFLSPQTHKVARGQLVVLPSRTLLVDFREGERRQGRQGIEVLTISPDGGEVCIVQHNLPRVRG